VNPIFNTTTSAAPERQLGFAAAFVWVTSLFFLWALAHNLNDILIKQFEKALQLSRLQASFIQIAFYLAYFLFSLPAGYVLKSWGSKRSLILGLVLYGLGAVAFFPAAALGHFSPFLVALMIIASGVVFLEIAAGAFMVLGGKPETAVFRINLAQGFNGLGAVVAPILGGLFIFSGNELDPVRAGTLSAAELAQFRTAELHQVQLPYLTIGVIAFAVAASIALTRFPAESRQVQAEPVHWRELLKAPGFAFALLAQFCYVGAQVGAWSFFIDFAKETVPSLQDRSAAYFLSGSLLLFMLGRFSGALLLRRVSGATLLLTYAVAASVAVALAVLSHGTVSLACLMAISFFMSIMYPTNFALGIAAAGSGASMAAAIMVMTIVGGAVIPPAMGWLADHAGLRAAYLLLTVCFAVVGIFARSARRMSAALPNTYKAA
jgi:MFS transporter, FHS family, L-fucose permease